MSGYLAARWPYGVGCVAMRNPSRGQCLRNHYVRMLTTTHRAAAADLGLLSACSASVLTRWSSGDWE